MRKGRMIVMVLSACVCMASAALAEGFYTGSDSDKFRPSMGRTILGTVTAVDEKKGDIDVLDEAKHYPITVHLKEEDRSRVKVGDRVRIRLQTNTNVARMIIQERPLKDKQD